MATAFEVQGVGDVLRKIHGLKGPALAAAAKVGLKRGAQQYMVPTVKAFAPENSGSSPWERYPGKRGGPIKRKITMRQVKVRPGEIAAVSVGPRTWYARWVVGGTKPHVIRNAVFNGIFRSTVHHPGARPNPFVQRAARYPALGEALAQEIARALNARTR